MRKPTGLDDHCWERKSLKHPIKQQIDHLHKTHKTRAWWWPLHMLAWWSTFHLLPQLPKLYQVCTLEWIPSVVFFSSSANTSLESSSENCSFWFIWFSLSRFRVSWYLKLTDACWMRWSNCFVWSIICVCLFDHFLANSQNLIICGASLSH